jgi:hypothetical protein
MVDSVKISEFEKFIGQNIRKTFRPLMVMADINERAEIEKIL